MNWNNIITSAIVSLIISLTTFLLGLKAGKNQADRAMLKALYLNLYTHFSKLFDSVDSERPLRWQNFKCVQTADSTRSLPLVREMIDDGTIIEVNKKMATQMEKIETDILVLSSKQYGYYSEIENIILNHAQELIGRELFKEYGSYRTLKDINGKAYFSVAYGVFFSKTAYQKIRCRLENNEKAGLSLHYTDNQNKINSITIYQDELIGSSELCNFLESVNAEINTLDITREILDSKKQILGHKNQLLLKLERKAKDPHRVLETLVGALTDIFK